MLDLIPLPYRVLLAALAVAASAGAGFKGGIEWHKGRDAVALEAARQAAKDDAKAADITSMNHAATVEKLNKQLGDTRAQLRNFTSGRACLSADAVRLLNAGSGAAVPTPSGESASAPERSATDRDVGDALAICRSGYSKLAAQLNAILDIDERRSPLTEKGTP